MTASKADPIKQQAAILRQVKGVLSAYAPKLNGEVEAWRWDQPDVTLTWSDRQPPFISRNIHVWIEAGPPRSLAFEANAWLDAYHGAEKKGDRKWAHRPMGRVEIPEFEEPPSVVVSAIGRKISEAYGTASTLGEKDLTKESPVSRPS